MNDEKELVQKYFDEELDEEGFAELQRLISSDEEMLRRFVREASLHAGLRGLMRGESYRKTWALERRRLRRRIARARAPVSKNPRRVRGRAPALAILGASAAAAVLLVLTTRGERREAPGEHAAEPVRAPAREKLAREVPAPGPAAPPEPATPPERERPDPERPEPEAPRAVAVLAEPAGADVLRPDGTHLAGTPGTEILPGDTVSSARDVTVVELPGIGRLSLGAGARCTLAPCEEGLLVRLEAGRLLAESGKPRGLVVRTEHADLVDIGTEFSVETAPETTRAYVEAGEVVAGNPGGRVSVSAGSVLSVRAGSPPGPVKPGAFSNELVAWTWAALGRYCRPLVLYAPADCDELLLPDSAGRLPGMDVVARGGASLPREARAPVVVSGAGGLFTHEPARPLAEACMRSGELTIEAWIEPSDPEISGPARVVTMSVDPFTRNFTLGMNGPHQPEGTYGVRLRTTETSLNGTIGDVNGPPVLCTPVGAVRAALTHLVFTRASDGGTAFYVNGEEAARGRIGGSFRNWDEGFPFGLANEWEGRRPWLGRIYLVALYDRALGRQEVAWLEERGPLR